jgi:hypothetical protein
MQGLVSESPREESRAANPNMSHDTVLSRIHMRQLLYKAHLIVFIAFSFISCGRYLVPDVSHVTRDSLSVLHRILNGLCSSP